MKLFHKPRRFFLPRRLLAKFLAVLVALLPAVLISGDLSEDLTLSALDKGASEFALKPIRYDEVELRLRHILQHPAVGTVIPGMRKLAHVDQNLAASDGRPLPAGLLAELRRHRWDRWIDIP